MQNSLSLTADQPVTMTSREIAELTGKEHRNVVRDIRSMIESLDEDVLRFEHMLPDAYGRMQPTMVLDREMTELLLTGYSVPLRRKVLARLRELENSQPSVDTHEGALIALQAVTAKQLALIQENKQIARDRDDAIRTKAQIGDKKVATAMATASHLKRENNKLKHELGRSHEHATVTAVENATGRKFAKNVYVALRSATSAHGLNPDSVPDERYGSVKAWPAIAWREVHGIDLDQLFPGEQA